MTPNLAWLDYQTTNSTDLFAAYEELLANNTMVNGHLDPQTGLLNTSWPVCVCVGGCGYVCVCRRTSSTP